MMERFVIVLDAAVLDPPLHFISFSAYKDSIASFAHEVNKRVHTIPKSIILISAPNLLLASS